MSPQVKRIVIISNKHGMYVFTQKLPKILRVRALENYEQNPIELQPRRHRPACENKPANPLNSPTHTQKPTQKHTPAPRQIPNAEAPARRCSQNRCPSKFSNIRNHRKTPALESPLNQVADPQACSPLKRRLQQRCFYVNIVKFL